MKINKTIVIAIVLFGLLVGGLGAGVLLSQRPLSVNAAPQGQEDMDAVDEAGEVEDDDGDEAEEAVSPDQAGISAEEAKAAAEAAYPGAKTLEIELERQGGEVTYEVELDNGLEVLIDAANAEVLGAERDDAD